MTAKKIWDNFTRKLEALNKGFAQTRSQVFILKKTLEFYKKNTGSLPFGFDIETLASYERTFRNYERAVNAINNSFALSQTNKAAIAESTSYPGDLDFIVDSQRLSKGDIDAATFNRADLTTGKETELGAVAILPLIVKAGATVYGLITVKGIVDSVGKSIVETARIERKIQEIQANVENDMSKNPNLFSKWTQYKTQTIIPQAKSFLASLGSKLGTGLSPIITAGLILVGGMILFKVLESRK